MNSLNKKIFHLGFLRSGSFIIANTLELAEKKIAYSRIQTSRSCFNQKLGIVMYNNLNEKNKIIIKELENYDGYFNLLSFFPERIFYFEHYFKEMETQNPGSQFIITVRPILEYVLSMIYLLKDSPMLYSKDLNTEKIISWIDDYFEHSLNVRNYFNQSNIKKRSKLYVYIPGKITPEELLKRMKIYLYPNVKVDLKDFSEFKFIPEDYNIYINDKIIKIIKEKLQKYGDPSTFEWWNQQ